MSVSFTDAVVLVTGANGGLGEQFVAQALELGAAKVYATARTPRTWDDARVVPLRLDVTDEVSVAAAAAAAADVTILVNNAGIILEDNSLTTGSIEAIRAVFETNFFGALLINRAFAPVLGANGGGGIIDVHSALSWLGVSGAYSATKAAFWSATNSFRLDLAPQGTAVLGLHLGFTDTPMVKNVEGVEKGDPAEVVRAAYDGLASGLHEVLADETSRTVKAGLSGPLEGLYPQLAAVGASAR